MADPKPRTQSKQDGPDVSKVEALATLGSATFMSDVLEDAHAAYRRELEGLTVPAPEDTAPRPLTAVSRGALRTLGAHRVQLVNAFNATDGGGS